MSPFKLNITILKNGHYVVNETMSYYSKRYDKTITVPEGRDSDGATGAMDIASRGWLFHDELCKQGKWDDGTPINNWQCSQVLQDILVEEGRVWQGHRWFWATWLLGGGRARKNGMLTILLGLCLLNSGCINLNTQMVCGEHNQIKASDNDTPKTSTDVEIPFIK